MNRFGYIGRVGRVLGSLQLGVALLAVLFVLVFWGTLFCARAGMDLGVERFFDSWFLFVAGFLPFPALKTLAALLALNLLCAVLFRIPHTLKNGGILLVHVAVLFLIFGSFAGERSRESFAALGLEGSRLVVDSADGTAFRILSADSLGSEISIEESGEAVRVLPNSPVRVGSYTLYFAESTEIFPGKRVVRYWLTKDPFAFVPYLFSGMLFFGLLWHGTSMRRRAK